MRSQAGSQPESQTGSQTRSPAGSAAAAAPAARLLGAPQLLDRRTGRWFSLPPKAGALLALLVLQGPTPRSRIASWLWPTHDADKARVNLRGLLRDLRARAGAEIFTGHHLLALAPGLTHDLLPASTPAGPETWRADLLGACDFSGMEEFDAWLQSAREQLRRQALDHWLGRAQTLAAAGRSDDAEAALRQAIATAPLDEAPYQALMRQRAQSGDRVGALQAFAQCREALQRELGAGPTQPLRALAMLIELGEPLSPVPADDVWGLASVQPVRCVARDAECGMVRDAWSGGRHVLVEGEPGIGKTRLAQELAGTAGTVLVAALTGDADLPFATLTRVLRALLSSCQPVLPDEVCNELGRLLPELGRPTTAPAHMQTLGAALDRAWAGFGRAGVRAVLVDDLHWADEVSCKLMLRLGAVAEAPRWLLTRRRGEPPDRLRDAVDADADRWQVLSLSPLGPQAVAELLRSLAVPVADADDWAHWFEARASGSPFHVLELVHALVRDRGAAVLSGPPPPDVGLAPTPSLAQLLDRRIAGLQAEELDLARLMALAGNLFSIRLGCTLLAMHELALARLCERLQDQGVAQGSRLAHDLLCAPLLAQLPAEVARRMHQRIADLSLADGAPAALVAPHYRQAQAWPQAADAFEQAARQARALSARADELRLWDDAAVAHGHCLNARAAFAARLQAFDASLAVLPSRASEARARALQAAAVDALQRVEADLALARCAAVAYRWQDGVDLAGRAWQALEAPQRPAAAGTAGGGGCAEPAAPAVQPPVADLRPRAAMLLATCLAGSGRCDEAHERLRHVQQQVQASADPRLHMDHAATLGFVCHMHNRFDAAEAAYRDALRAAEHLQDGAEIMTLAANLAVQQQRRGDLAGALRSSELGERWALRIGEAVSLPGITARMSRATLAARLGRLGEAVDTMQGLWACLQASDGERHRMVLGCNLALAWVDLGQEEPARAALSQALQWPSAAGSALAATSQLAVERLACGDEEAPLCSDPDATLAAVAGDNLPSRMTLQLALMDERPPADAVRACQVLARQAAAAGLRAAETSAGLLEADSWRRCGDHDRAVARLREALQGIPQRHPLGMNLARVWWLAWRIFDAGAAVAEARHALCQGVGWVQHHAQAHVPAHWRYGFQRLNPVHRSLLAAAEAAGLGDRPSAV